MKKIKAISLDFCKGNYDWELPDKIWPEVFKYLQENADSLIFEKELIHSLWTQSGGHLRRKVQDDNLLLSVLMRCLPSYSGEGLILYRGECNFLYESQKIGFCWTPKKEVAKNFASGLNALESGGVLLKAYAPKLAIMCAPNKHSSEQMREFEYTCNPNMLVNIEVIGNFP